MDSKIYQQVTKDIGLIDLNHRCWVEVKGPDSRKFLNGILTNNIQTLQGKSGCYAAICTPKGKMVADLFCYTCEDYFGMDCHASLKPTVLETLKRYIIFQKVELHDQTEKWAACAVMGLRSEAFLKSLLKSLPAKDYEYSFSEWEGFKIWMIRKTMWGLPAFELWVKREQLVSLKAKLNLPEISSEIQEILRVESATPLFGVDMDENTIPQEANLYSALSFNKGCYVGQEIVARLEHRGHVGKKLVQLKLEGNILPKKGEKIFSNEGQEIGIITSSCFSPKHNAPLALGFIRYASLDLKEVSVLLHRAHRL